MDRSQIRMHRHLYMAFVCAVLCTLMIFSAGCTGTDSSSPAASPTPAQSAGTGGVQDGDLVEIEYTGTLENGSVFDSSKDHGPFQFIIGTGSAIAGFDREVRGMNPGESKKFTLSPEDAYGEYDPALIQSMPIDFIPEGENVTVGDVITLFDGESLFPATVAAMNATNVTFDLNHRLAGKSLTFDVTLINLTPASEVEEMMAAFEDETFEMDETFEDETFEMPIMEMEDEPEDGVLPEENETRTL